VLTIRFYPESDRTPDLAPAAAEYQRLWDVDGGRVVACLEGLTGLRFAETRINALVDERPGQSHPLVLRASTDAPTKAGGLVHELGHRLLSGNRAALGLPPARLDRPVETHQFLDLFLFHAWTDLYGRTRPGAWSRSSAATTAPSPGPPTGRRGSGTSSSGPGCPATSPGPSCRSLA
jgi:hypothetical protein